jgi:hypothetical protein
MQKAVRAPDNIRRSTTERKQMDVKAFEMAMAREMLFGLAVGLIALILSIWITYLVIKNAIRDGINESRLGDKWRASVASAQSMEDMPDMKAER